MSIDTHLSAGTMRTDVPFEREQATPPAIETLTRLYRDTDLLLAARSLLVRATSPLNRSVGRTILGDHISSLLGSTPSASVNRARLEVFAAAEHLLDPISRLTAALEAPARPTLSWSHCAPDACAEIEAALDVLRDCVESPHLVTLFALLEALLAASDERAWARVEALAAEQNMRAMQSLEPVVVFASLFWTEDGTAWPAIYLVEKSSAPKCPKLQKVRELFAALEPRRATPSLCFATKMIFAPSKADANAFALHNQAALIFELVDPERRARFARLASVFGVDAPCTEELGRVFLAGHELGHKVDPLNLPKWTEELFADVAGVVATADTIGNSYSPDIIVRVLLVEALSNYGRPVDEPASTLYIDSTDQIVLRLMALGAIKLNGAELIVDVDQERWTAVVEDFRASWKMMREGLVPEYFRRGAPVLEALRLRIRALISSGTASAQA
jgi:hypothetical protein